MLPLGLTAEALAAATAEPDPDSLAAGTRMRARFGTELAAAALTQVALRRRAAVKFGADAERLFFTRDGLEQATRPAVAAHHAARFRTSGVTEVVDLGCGIGADALAFLAAGLAVLAVEIDPATAEVAAANLAALADPLGPASEVMVADAEQLLLERQPAETSGWFADPARRDRTGRVWNVSEFAPSWPFVLRLLAGGRTAGVKLGPALPHSAIPPGVEAEWVSHDGTTVEVGLWAGGTAAAGARRATVLDALTGPASLLVEGTPGPIEVGPIGRYVYDPDGAVIRAGAIPLLADRLEARLVDAKIAYLSSEHLLPTPFARAYEVLDRLPHSEPVLRSWLRERQIGVVEIMQRGIELDPARLRRRLAPRGPGSATLLITRTPKGAAVLSVRRTACT
jgi:SAM-dependent methyltransferase